MASGACGADFPQDFGHFALLTTRSRSVHLKVSRQWSGATRAAAAKVGEDVSRWGKMCDRAPFANRSNGRALATAPGQRTARGARFRALDASNQEDEGWRNK